MLTKIVSIQRPEVPVLCGAVLIAGEGRLSVSAPGVVVKNVVIRGRARHLTVIGDYLSRPGRVPASMAPGPAAGCQR